MKNWGWVLLLVLINACQKQELDPNGSIIGKWRMPYEVVKVSYKYPIMCYFDNKRLIHENSVTVEISQDGRLIYESDNGRVIFRIIKDEKFDHQICYNPNLSEYNDIEGHVFTVKDGKGKKFEFKFFYDPITQVMLGVAWYKGISYNTYDHPVASGFHYGILLLQSEGYNYPNSDGSDLEYLGIFEKI